MFDQFEIFEIQILMIDEIVFGNAKRHLFRELVCV
jgi:hypothetical protein